MKTRTMIALCVALCCGNAPGQEQRQKPKELEALGQYVGHWTSDVTNKRAEWVPREIKYHTSNHATFVLNGWFLMHSEVNHVVDEPKQVTKSLFVWTYDPSLNKNIGWWFQSSGLIAKVTGSWDATSQTFTTHGDPELLASTAKLTETFVSKNAINGSLTLTSNDGLKLVDMVWTRTRREDDPDPATQERWAMIGTPIEPIPPEVKKLEPLIGKWESEFIQRPSAISPQGGTSKGTMKADWILDGRFLLGESDLGNYQSIWVIGYDTNKRAYRYVRMGSNGQIEENLGQWNESARSFEWKGVNGQPGITRSSTNRLIGNDAVEAQIIAKTPDGTVQMDLTIKSARRK